MPVFQGLRRFPECRTFSVKTGAVLDKLGCTGNCWHQRFDIKVEYLWLDGQGNNNEQTLKMKKYKCRKCDIILKLTEPTSTANPDKLHLVLFEVPFSWGRR